MLHLSSVFPTRADFQWVQDGLHSDWELRSWICFLHRSGKEVLQTHAELMKRSAWLWAGTCKWNFCLVASTEEFIWTQKRHPHSVPAQLHSGWTGQPLRAEEPVRSSTAVRRDECGGLVPAGHPPGAEKLLAKRRPDAPKHHARFPRAVVSPANELNISSPYLFPYFLLMSPFYSRFESTVFHSVRRCFFKPRWSF